MNKSKYEIGDIVECDFHDEGGVPVEINGIKYDKDKYENIFNWYYTFIDRKNEAWVHVCNIRKLVMNKEEVYNKYYHFWDNIGKNLFLVSDYDGEILKVFISGFDNVWGSYIGKYHNYINQNPEMYFKERTQAVKKAKEIITNKIKKLKKKIKELK